MGVPGVANVAIWGVNPRQIMVEGDPARMLAHGITLDELMATAADSVDAGLLGFTTGSAIGARGFIETPTQRLDVANIQLIQTPAQMAEVPLETGNGKLITIGEVATVAWGYPTLIGDALVNGGHGLMMVVEKFPGANTLQVTRGVEAALAALAPGLHGVHVDSRIFRQAAFIQTAIGNLGLSVVLGCILVVFVLLAFLFQGGPRWSACWRSRCRWSPRRSCSSWPGRRSTRWCWPGSRSRSGWWSTTPSSTWRTSCGGCAPGAPRASRSPRCGWCWPPPSRCGSRSSTRP